MFTYYSGPPVLNRELMSGPLSWRPRSPRGSLYIGALPAQELRPVALQARWDCEVFNAQMAGLPKPRIRIRVWGVPARW